MLPYSETTNVNSIELLVCRKMQSCKQVPMDKETGIMLIQLLTSKDANKILIPEKEKPFLFKLIESRIEHCFTFKVEEHRLILFLSIISKNPGSAVLYLWYLQYYCFNNKIIVLTLDILCDIFPNGFISENDLTEIWNSQKVIRGENDRGSDNLVDYSTAGDSIQFKEETV